MSSSPRPALWFWIVAILALCWNLFGLLMFWQNFSATPESIAALPEPNRQIASAMPRWILVPFALATVAGVLGALGLLLRRRWAVPLLLLSLVALVVQFVSVYATTPVWALTGAGGAVFPIVLWVVALLLWGYARRAARKGWLR